MCVSRGASVRSWCVSAIVVCAGVRCGYVGAYVSSSTVRSYAIAPPCLLQRVAAAFSGMVQGAFLIAFLAALLVALLVAPAF